MFTNMIRVGALTLTGVLTVFVPGAVMAKVHTGKVYTVQTEASRLMKDVEERAYEIHDHALTLQAADTVSLDRSFFMDQATALRDDINDAGKVIAHLRALNAFETPADKTTVDRAEPMLAKVAASTTSLIDYINAHGNNMTSQQYTNLASSLASQTGSLWNLLHDSVRLSSLKVREKHLKADLSKTAHAKS